MFCIAYAPNCQISNVGGARMVRRDGHSLSKAKIEVADCQMGARRLLPQWPVGCAHRRHRPRYFADHEGCCFHEIVAHVGGERRSRSRSW